MPIYYNPSSPTPNSLNTINSTTIGTVTGNNIRDFLLSKNIQNPIKYPQLSTSINGAPKGGEPFLDTMVGSGVVIPQPSIEVDGIHRYNIGILPNLYKNTDPKAPQLVDVTLVPQIPIYPQPANGTTQYNAPDANQYGILPKSQYSQYLTKSTIWNLYSDSHQQIDIADYISLQPIQYNSRLGSYLDEYTKLNGGQGGATAIADGIADVLNGQSIGLAKAGVTTDFDLKATLAGRVLTAAGLTNDTKLGVIGGQQLALSLANNAAFNVQQQLIGALNIQDNVLSLVKGNGWGGLRPDYSITIPSSTGGKILSYTEKILGFFIPKSYLSDSGSIFVSESGPISNTQRANSMLTNTGNGQLLALKNSVTANINGTGRYDDPDLTPFRSGYAPAYNLNKGASIPSLVNDYAFMSNGQIYNFLKSEVIPEISYNREKMIEENYGFTDYNSFTYGISDGAAFRTKFSWGSTNGDALNSGDNIEELGGGDSTVLSNKKSLLVKTQALFSNKGMRSLVSVKGDMTVNKSTQTQTVSGVGGISKGSAVLSGWLFDNKSGQLASKATGQTADSTFCRAWTPYNRYDSVYKLIRSRGLNQSENGGGNIIQNDWRQHIEGSVLGDNGFVQIAPYKTDTNINRSGTYGGGIPTSPKKYMFSIENLAWAGSAASNLLPIEQGAGDLLTGKFGRMMWFPPYDLTFSETSSVNLETTNFIGRGEPIFTYNNTERSGNLSFKILADHPSIMNSFAGNNGPSDDFIRSYISGCLDLDSSWGDKLTYEEKQEIKTSNIQNVTKKIADKPKDITFNVYFPNDVYNVEEIFTLGNGKSSGYYESGDSTHNNGTQAGIGTYNGDSYVIGGKTYISPIVDKDGVPFWPDNSDSGLNVTPITFNNVTYLDGWNDTTFINDLRTYLASPNTDGSPLNWKASVSGFASTQSVINNHNKLLADERATSLKNWLVSNNIIDANKITVGKADSTSVVKGSYSNKTPVDQANKSGIGPKNARYATVTFSVDGTSLAPQQDKTTADQTTQPSLSVAVKKRFYTELDFFEKLQEDDPFVFDTIREKIRYFHPAFHSMTPEGFNARLTFLLQCTRQGATQNSNGDPQNLAFGQPPVCILRIGDFYNTKIMIDSLSINYEDQLWDLNPEGVGVQPMIATVNMSFKYIGGSTLFSPINKLQNALSFNYFANAQVYDPRADYVSAAPPVKVNNSDGSISSIQQTDYDAQCYILNNGLDPLTTSLGLVSKGEVQVSVTPAPGKNDILNAQNSNTTPVNATISIEDADIIMALRLDSVTNYKTIDTDFINRGFLLNLSFNSNLSTIGLKSLHTATVVYNNTATNKIISLGKIQIRPLNSEMIYYDVFSQTDASKTVYSDTATKNDILKFDILYSSSNLKTSIISNLDNIVDIFTSDTINHSDSLVTITFDTGWQIKCVPTINNF